MGNAFLSKKNFFLFAVTILVSAGCNNENTDKTEPAKPAVTDTVKSSSEPAYKKAAFAFPGKLDTLYAVDTSFLKVPNGKTVFAFTFGADDTLTLHGWDAKGVFQNGFDSIPDIALIKGHPSKLDYGPGTYFGNVILNDAKEIKKLLKKTKTKYVLFAPEKIGEHISYNIFLSNDDPALIKTFFAPIPTNISANPSPPKKY